MEPRNYTINQLFNGTEVYVVPKYQRLYVWNEEDQWAPLWEDVQRAAEDLITDALRNGSTDIDPKNVESHFFGTLVLKQSGYTPESADRWRVIDGQQRLTTLQLMMSGVADEFRFRQIPDRPMRNLIENNSETNPLKIEHASDRYRGFAEIMSRNVDKLNVKGNMADCYRFFLGQIQRWLNSDRASLEMSANALRNAIVNNLRVVAIYLAGHEEEHKIFETLNARGERLTEWDKIKNFLLYKADQQNGIDLDRFYDIYLDDFDDAWWKQETGRGIGRRQRSDVFADYWLESKLTRPVGTRRVFREFSDYVNNRTDELKVIGDELIEDAAYFRKNEKTYTMVSTRERRFHNRRLWMGIGGWWPMILELNRTFSRLNCDQDVRSACFVHLESYLARRLICGHRAQSYDQVGFDLIEDIHDNGCTTDQLAGRIGDHLSDYTRTSNRWPSDSDVEWAVLNRRMPWYVQKLVLEAVELWMISPDAGHQDVSPDLEVEHLMPQSWKENDWPLLLEYERNQAIELRDRLIHTLGNLTLIRSGLNKRASNQAWDKKLNLIEKSDNLFLNRKIRNAGLDVWDEEQIQRRGKWLAQMVCQLWPRPTGP